MAEPVFEARCANARVVTGDEQPVVKFRAEIARMGIRKHLSRIVGRFQKPRDKFAHAVLAQGGRLLGTSIRPVPGQ